jgi:hypothetical protein
MKDPATGFKWELYNVSKDWTENNDLAASNPPKLKELQDLFWVEARKYQVLPLDASGFTRCVAPRPNVTAGRAEFNSPDRHSVGRCPEPSEYVLHHNR